MSTFVATLWLYLLTCKKIICDCEKNNGFTAIVCVCYLRPFIIIVNIKIKTNFCIHAYSCVLTRYKEDNSKANK